MKTLSELQKEIDDLYAAGDSSALEARLLEICREGDAEIPEDYTVRCALYNELGSFYRGKARYEEGERAFIRARELMEESGEANLLMDPNYATTLNNLAGLYRMSGEFDRSLELFRKAQSIYDTRPDTDYKTLASCHNNIALLYIRTGKADEALKELETAAEMIKDKPGNEYVTTVTLSNTAFALNSAGRIKEAARVMEQAVKAAVIAPGEESDLYKVCSHYAAVFRSESEEKKQ